MVASWASLLLATIPAQAAGWVSLMQSADEVAASSRHVDVVKVLPSNFVSEVPDEEYVYDLPYQREMKAMLRSFDEQTQSSPVLYPEFYSLQMPVKANFRRHAQDFFDTWTTQDIYLANHEGATYLLTPSTRYSWVGEPSGTRLIFVWKWNTHSLSLVSMYKSTRSITTGITSNLPRYRLVVNDGVRMLKLAAPEAQGRPPSRRLILTVEPSTGASSSSAN